MGRFPGRVLFLLIFFLLAGSVTAPANPVSTGGDADLYRVEVEFHALPAGNSVLSLAHGFIQPASLRVILGDSLLVDGRDVRLRGRSGVLVPLHPWREFVVQAGDTTGEAVLVVSYRFKPVAVPARLDLRAVGAGPGHARDHVPAASPKSGETMSQDTGRLSVRGSKTIQVSGGSRRDMVVDQNLRLDITGQLTPDISVRAFLSDDNLPVVPEGNTQQLRDIDKVLVQIKGRGWSSTLGDFVARRSGLAFGNYRRKLQGVSLEGKAGGTSFEVLAGSPRGRYRTLQIKGQEANQGPYFLGGGDAAANLFIVAGSERVTLDGIPLVRGSDRDYVIDYVRGTVTFTYKRLITAESSIVVEFEEGEGPYGRTVTGAGAGTDFTLPGLDAKGTFGMRVITEKDDPGRLRTGTLGPEDEAILAAAGDDQALAVASGVVAVSDSTGSYNLVGDGGTEHYEQAPGHGAWNLDFYFVGPGLGDYDLDSLGPAGERLFVYRGPGLGGYLIGRPLELPVSHSMMSFMSTLGDTGSTHLAAEWDISRQDLNQLSDIGDGDNHGGAVHVEGTVSARHVHPGKVDLGKVKLKARFDDLTSTFRPFELTRDIFSYRRWGLEERARRPGFLTEADRQWTIDGDWEIGGDNRRLELGLERSGLVHGAGMSADLVAWRGKWRLGGLTGEHGWTTGRADDDQDPLDIENTRRRHEISWQLAWLRPGFRYGFERWRDAAAPAGRAAGYRREQYGWLLEGKNGRALTWQASFDLELADSLRADGWARHREGRTTRLDVATGSLGGMRLVGEGTLRRILKPDLPAQTTRLAQATLAGKWKRTDTDFSLTYRVDNSRTEVLDRQIIFVGDRLGDYDQDGRYLGEDLGSYDMVLAGTDSLVATTAVKADLNWRQGFSFLGRERWFGAWSLLTLASVEGRSTTDDVGGLLRLDPGLILRDSTTVLGDVYMSEELTLLQNHPGIDIRGKFQFRQTRDRQFASHPEDRLQRSWQLRGNVRASRFSSWQCRLLTSRESRTSSEDLLSARRSFGVGTESMEFGWTYGPGPQLRFSLSGEYIRREDDVTGVKQTEWVGHPTLRRRLTRVWTLQTDVRAGNVISNEPVGATRPWFFPTAGVKVETSFRLAWEPSPYLTVSASWFARKEGERRWQHDVRLESTARF